MKDGARADFYANKVSDLAFDLSALASMARREGLSAVQAGQAATNGARVYHQFLRLQTAIYVLLGAKPSAFPPAVDFPEWEHSRDGERAEFEREFVRSQGKKGRR